MPPDPPVRTMRVLAPAKLTLSLRVLHRRADGYHELEALTVSVDRPHDTITVELATAPGVHLELDGPADDVPSGPANLAARAAGAVLPADVGVRIALRKEIPAGAGLGGGSSDAAAVLRALRDLAGVDAAAFEGAAAALGSDVPFCLRGAPAWMRGRGDRLEPASLVAPLDVVVAVPPFRLSTPAVYAAWDQLGGPTARRTVLAPAAVSPLVAALSNDLEPAAERVEPALAHFRDRVEQLCGRPAVLAGSGSAYAVVVDGPRAAREVAERIGDEPGVSAWAGRSLG